MEKKLSIHAHSHSTDMFRAIDTLSNKLDRQVVKYKERADQSWHQWTR